MLKSVAENLKSKTEIWDL